MQGQTQNCTSTHSLTILFFGDCILRTCVCVCGGGGDHAIFEKQDDPHSLSSIPPPSISPSPLDVATRHVVEPLRVRSLLVTEARGRERDWKRDNGGSGEGPDLGVVGGGRRGTRVATAALQLWAYVSIGRNTLFSPLPASFPCSHISLLSHLSLPLPHPLASLSYTPFLSLPLSHTPLLLSLSLLVPKGRRP